MAPGRWRRRLAGCAVAAAVGLLLLGVGGWFWLSTALPPLSGEIMLPGLAHPVEIAFDAAAVPTIRAADERDGAFALGFLHAGNRLFQMEFMRRFASGRLAEVVGPRALATDRYMRLFDFAHLADTDFERLPAAPRALLEAYSRGVNAYLETHRGAWPPEFYLLRERPEPWRPQDSLLWGRLMALQLSTNWQDEWLRARLAQRLTPIQLESLWPALGPSLAANGAIDPAVSRRAAWSGDTPPPGPLGASNSWAVAGTMTDTGQPFLANDPHLDLGLPIQWYLARIETPERTLTGATAPGVPLFILGQNDHVAWGFTTTIADSQDLFVEKLAAGQPNYYLTPDGPQPFAERTETIHVRGAADVELTVRSSRHGPVISDLGRAAGIAGADEAIALAWACLSPADPTLAALYRMNRAADAAEFRAALQDFRCPVQNIVYADRDHIGYMAAGRIPVRRSVLAGGQMPAPGAQGQYDWVGFLGDDELPQLVDPPTGLLATANNDIRPPGYPYFVAGRFDAPFRVERIREAIADRRKTGQLALEDMTALQMDTLSLAAKSLLPKLLALIARTDGEPDPLAAKATALLEGWNFRVDRDLPQPLIFDAWLARLDRALFADELGDLFADYDWWNAATIARVLFGEAPADRAWCDDIGTPAAEDCATMARRAFASALADLARRYGEDPAAWRWGAAHRARFAHPLFGRIWPFDWLTRRDLPTDGDNYTLNRGVPDIDAAGVVFPDLHGAGYRGVYDLADPARSRFVIAGGQSGNPLSPHYADLLERWRDGSPITIVGDASGGRLRLLPATATGEPAPP
jgi:penicillin G amidase